MTRRRLADVEELRRHLPWLRFAVHDRNIDVRLVLEGILDALDALTDLAEGARPPKGPA